MESNTKPAGIEWVKIDSVEPHPLNPRIITEYKLEELKKSLQAFPEMMEYRPLIVERESGYIIGGNQRQEAARQLGWEEIPVIYVEGLDQDTIKAMMLKDNIQFGEWDFTKLKEFYTQDNLLQWGLEDAKYVSFEKETDSVGEGNDDDSGAENGSDDDDTDYGESYIKKIVFFLDAEDFDLTLEKMVAFAEKNELKDNSEVLLKLLELHEAKEAENEHD